MKIVIRRPDGSVAIMTILGPGAEALRLAPEHMDTIVETEIAQWQLLSREEILDWKVVKDEDVPTDRTFRNAWKFREEKVEVDLERAKEIALVRRPAAEAQARLTAAKSVDELKRILSEPPVEVRDVKK